uniref:L-ascorbate peroxidase n=1 Tax=Rhizophora mucronata TaxID=61149 RepID=A0A2P2JGR7_RHIMU
MGLTMGWILLRDCLSPSRLSSRSSPTLTSISSPVLSLWRSPADRKFLFIPEGRTSLSHPQKAVFLMLQRAPTT